MRIFQYFFAIPTLALLLWGCDSKNNNTNNATTDEGIHLKWRVLENDYEGQTKVLSEFMIINNSDKAFPKEGWELYFNFCRKMDPATADLSKNVTFEHVNGDFFKMKPNESFKEIAAGDSLRFQFLAGAWTTTIYEAPDHPFLVYSDGSTAEFNTYNVAPFTEEKQTKRFSGDVLPVADAAYIFDQNKNLERLDKKDILPIIPAPYYIKTGDEQVTLDNSFQILHDDQTKSEAEFLQEELAKMGINLSLGTEGEENKTIQLAVAPTAGVPAKSKTGSYSLLISSDEGIKISGFDKAGVFYGIQSLRALVPVNEFEEKDGKAVLQTVEVNDHPRFGHRGMLLDVGRNFHSKESVLKLLDMMAFYKLNKFHFHISDDEGWRLQIPSFPELTEIGSKRGYSLDEATMLQPAYGSGPDVDAEDNHGTGHYSTGDFIEILKFAKARHIEVIPEIDMPGHARAAIISMNQRYKKLMAEGNEEEAKKYDLIDRNDESEYESVQMFNDNVVCPCQESTYDFLEVVVDEVYNMYKAADAPLTSIHIGGDEVPHGVWRKSPKCQEMFADADSLDYENIIYRDFVGKFSDIVAEKGLVISGWEEIAMIIDKEIIQDKNGKPKDTVMHIANPDFVSKGFQPTIWNNVWTWGGEDMGYKIANEGYKVILSNATNLYFDLCYEKHPEEPGYYWAAYTNTRNTFEFTPMDLFKSAYYDRMGNALDETLWKDKKALNYRGRQNVLGIQGQLWSETVKGMDRQQYMIFPRLLALAQRAWSEQPEWATIDTKTERIAEIDKDWNVFANTLGQTELPRMNHLNGGINYRVPTPGASFVEGKLVANIAYPGLTIRYTADGTEPTNDSQEYIGEVVAAPNAVYKLKAFSGVKSSRTVTLRNEK